MDEIDLDMLKAIAQEKNVTRAAQFLCIAQSAFSYRLKKLKNEFNTNIVVRTPTGVIFTPEGEYLLQCAKNIQEEIKNTKEYIQRTKGNVQGILRIAVTTAFARYELADILQGFLNLYPDVEIFLKTNKSQNVYSMLQKNEVTIAIVRGDNPWIEKKYLICNEPICLIANEPLEMRDLPNKPQIIHPFSGVSNIAEKWWRENFSVPSYISMEIDDMDIGLKMVLKNLGWTIMPKLGLNNYPSLYKKELHWKNGKPLLRQTWLMCRNSSLELIAVKTFLEYIKRHSFSI